MSLCLLLATASITSRKLRRLVSFAGLLMCVRGLQIVAAPQRSYLASLRGHRRTKILGLTQAQLALVEFMLGCVALCQFRCNTSPRTKLLLSIYRTMLNQVWLKSAQPKPLLIIMGMTFSDKLL